MPEGRGSFPPDFVDEVRRAASIVQVVERHVALKRAGRTLKGLCPFHAEKTPSFTVDEAKGFYHCFGCQAGGDVFGFVMQQEAMTFPEAVRHLAEMAGVAVPELRTPSAGDALRERILEINRAAQEAFVSELAAARTGEAREAAAYLERRGIGRDVVEAFGIGYAPDDWDFLSDRFGRRYELRELTASGLCVPRESGRGAYDRFRGRVTFPIRALSDRILGFGGRVIGDGEPKYLNSPETPVYTKGHHLFGLDRARGPVRRGGRAILVEGYLDAISLHAAGVTESVAVLGTALTAEQARLIARFASEVVVSFDGDAAGQRAARKSIEVLLGEGLSVRIVKLPGGQDPDDFVRREGAEAFRHVVDAAPGYFEFLLGVAAREHDLGSPAGRVNALNDLLPFIVQVKDRVLRSELTDAAVHGLRIRGTLLKDEVGRALRRGQAKVEWKDAGPGAAVEATMAEKTLLSWLLADGRVRQALQDLTGDEALAQLPRAECYSAILAEPADRLDIPRVLSRIDDPGLRALVATCAVEEGLEPFPADAVHEKVRSFLEGLGHSPVDVARRRKAEINRQIADAERSGDREQMRRLMTEAQALGRAIQR
jgi:DNA primase